ncbi:MAG: DUF3224 domain-containing protein [Polymorphobacter sp.]
MRWRAVLLIAAALAAVPVLGATTMIHRAKGSFEVKITPQSPTTDPTLGRMDLDKTYHGDLEAHATGTMLTAMGSGQGNAVYVAVERVTGTLSGKAGSFALAHKGVMDHGAQSLIITIVPASGTGALAGIAGSMNIIIKDGGHFYTMDYHLPD